MGVGRSLRGLFSLVASAMSEKKWHKKPNLILPLPMILVPPLLFILSPT